VKTFKEMLSKSAERWGDRTFIRYDDDEITFREFDQTTDRVAHFLFQPGFEKGIKFSSFYPIAWSSFMHGVGLPRSAQWLCPRIST
jgi:acyl-CoA synthetase (AMP-forming)/AMP-acid ligase II